ncbi:MAG TPA: hypothetical protein VF472_14390 [Burkholderiaceae bacterium]
MHEADFYSLALGILCVWRITHLLQAEDGPWNMVLRLRRAAGDGAIGAMLDCFDCLSLWISIVFAALLAHGVPHGMLLWPALSGGAMLLQRVSAAKNGPEHADNDAPAMFTEDEEK